MGCLRLWTNERSTQHGGRNAIVPSCAFSRIDSLDGALTLMLKKPGPVEVELPVSQIESGGVLVTRCLRLKTGNPIWCGDWP